MRQARTNGKAKQMFSYRPARHRHFRLTIGYLFAILVTTNSANTAFSQPTDNATKTRSETWVEQLPVEIQQSILWKADYETGNLDEWSIPTSKDPGGGILLTDEENVTAQATTAQSHSGNFAAEATIRNAIRATRGNKAVRLMRWATDGYDRGGVQLPAEAYYSTWAYLPAAYDPKKHAPWDPGDGGWWNVFQFKSNDEQNSSQSAWALNIQKNPQNQQLSCYLYSHINTQKSWTPTEPVQIPVREWFHIEAYVKVSSEEQGRIEIWLDGVSIIQADNVRTAVNSPHPNVVWGIGNYTDHIAGGTKVGTATIYFDDSLISTRPVSAYAIRDPQKPATR